ncbi:MAG: hypothetical protein J6B86_04280 [Clostridia bacterium]|nr:hypothetical protein [Clostridia bacterium]
MKKKFRIAILTSPRCITQINQAMCLSFGAHNVAHSMRAEDLFGILKRLRPTTLIIEPELFYEADISPADIRAYQSQIHYKIITVYPTEQSLEIREKMKGLNPVKEYICPKEYLSMTMEIPGLSTNKYVKVKVPLQESTVENLERIFRECEFRCNMKGAPLLQEALYMMYFDEDLHRWGGARKIYLHLSEKYGYSPRIVARSMLRFIESSWTPRTEQLLRKELNIPDSRRFDSLSFCNFTEIFNTYYSIKFGEPKKILAYPRKH